MSQGWAETTIEVAGIYALVGLLFALWFVVRGVHRVDTRTTEAAWSFRLLLLPGAVALWPWLAWRLRRADGTPPTEANAHRRSAR